MNIQKMKLTELNPAKYNPRKDLKPGDPDYEKLKRSLQEFGVVDPLVWNKRTGSLVGGHQRHKVMLDLGITETEVSVVDLDEAKEKMLNVALNKISGDWDNKKLSDLLDDLHDQALDLSLTGFDEVEIDELLNTHNSTMEDDFDLDEAVNEIGENPTSKLGNMWKLGNHRLICGDSTVISTLERLLGGKYADMVFTDPPYNANYEGGTSEKLKIENDNMDDVSFYKFLYDAYVALITVTKPGGGIYVCHSDAEGVNFCKAMKDAGWRYTQCIVWVKNRMVMGRKDHHLKHEPILYGWKPGASHKWHGNRKQTTVLKENPAVVIGKTINGKTQITFDTGFTTVVVEVDNYKVISDVDDSMTSTWHFDKPLKNGEHPTMKPIGLVAKALKNSSKPGDIVLDSFGGSGSTLVAAEQLGRYGYLCELDPVYCDVIIKRYEQLTGEKAVAIG